MIAAPPWLATQANQRMVNKSFQIRSNGLTLAASYFLFSFIATGGLEPNLVEP